MTHLTQQLFIGGTNINTDVEKFKHEGGNIIIGTPGRIEDLLMGKTDSSHRNLFVQAAKTLVSHVYDKIAKISRPFCKSLFSNQFRGCVFDHLCLIYHFMINTPF